MALPLVIMLAWRSETHGGQTFGWFEWQVKWRWIYSALRDQWKWFDIGSLIAAAMVFLFAIFSRKLTLSRNLAFSAIVLAVSFVILPRTVFGSAYADMRLVPFLLAVGLLAIRFRGAPDRRTAHVLAVLGLLFFATRTAANTISLARAADDQSAKLAALDVMPEGARVITLTGMTLPRILAVAPQQPSRRDGDRPARGLLERPVAARGDQPARSQISLRRLFRRRPVAARAAEPMPRQTSPANR